jgi:NAD(P)-dependent dehydrogenase (short-subunit alcohol dehydrogenase family)
MSKTILITGASSGFGRDTAETVPLRPHYVRLDAQCAGQEPRGRRGPAEARNQDCGIGRERLYARVTSPQPPAACVRTVRCGVICKKMTLSVV